MNHKYSIFIKIFLLTTFIHQLSICNIKSTNINKSAKPKILKGSIKVNENWKNAPEFKIFFAGQETINNKEGFYSFNLKNNEDDLKKVSILICKELNPNFKGINTIKHLNINSDKPYKFFSFEQKEIIDDETKKVTDKVWDKREKTIAEKNFIVPKNCILILINPKYVETVENWNVKIDDNFIKLPQIILNNNFKEKIVQNQAAKSILRSLDFSTVHKNISKKTKTDDKKNIETILSSES